MKFTNLTGLVISVLPFLTAGLVISDVTGKTLSAFGKRSTVSTILADIEDAASCVACEVRHCLELHLMDMNTFDRERTFLI